MPHLTCHVKTAKLKQSFQNCKSNKITPEVIAIKGNVGQI